MNHFFWNAMTKRFASFLYHGFTKERVVNKTISILVFIIFIGVHIWIGSMALSAISSNINFVIVILLVLNVLSVCRQLFKLANHTFHEEDDLY